jgi:ammonium transporter Rh
MAGLGSIISTYIFCMIYEKKVNPLVYTYAMLCGPVAIGSPLLVVGPWGALLVGLGAGFISATCFIYLQPKLCKAMGVLDVMGVHNLHGVGGWFGAIVCAGIAAGGVNIVSAVGVFIISLVTGAITGGIIKATRGRMEDHELFRDDVDFSMWHEEPFELQEDGTVVKCE